jgi:hypothetical protein
MRVLLLTPIPHYLADPLAAIGDSYTVSMEKPELWPAEIDFVVSFGYRYIIPQRWIDFYRGRMVNIHISLLPWNRGSDPNFWSWFDRTPKGVSIHAIDEGIDTGELIAQREVTGFTPDDTLQTSYSKLVHTASDLFATEWLRIRVMEWEPLLVSGRGSYHEVADKEEWVKKLPLGWHTPVRDVEELGSASKGN